MSHSFPSTLCPNKICSITFIPISNDAASCEGQRCLAKYFVGLWRSLYYHVMLFIEPWFAPKRDLLFSPLNHFWRILIFRANKSNYYQGALKIKWNNFSDSLVVATLLLRLTREDVSFTSSLKKHLCSVMIFSTLAAGAWHIWIMLRKMLKSMKQH